MANINTDSKFVTASNLRTTVERIANKIDNHGTHVTYGTITPKANGSATPGTSSKVSREDHVHPLQTSVSGNAGSANKVNNSIKIQLNGGTTEGTNQFTFDGSAAKTINVTPSSIGTFTQLEINTKDTNTLNSAKSYTDTKIAALVDSAPDALNTLNELATAISDHQEVYDAYVGEISTALAGKADKSHGTHVTYSTDAPKVAGTASAGSANNVARGDHVHPLQTSVSGNAGTATQFKDAKSVTLTGDVTGTASSKAGWSVATTLSDSGVEAGSYGPSENATPGYNTTFNVPYITVDAKGRVTAASTKTVKIPATDNTDYRVKNEVNTTAKAYITGTTNASTNTGTQIFDTGVYLDSTAGQLVATTFKGNLTGNVTGNVTGSSGSCTGNAASATKLQTGRKINGTSFNGTGDITTANWGTTRSITIGGTAKNVNGSGNVSWSLNEIGAARGKTASATTAATAGWYRIATSAAGINNCFATFTVEATVSGKHSVTQFVVGTSYGQNPYLQQISHAPYSTTGITKARLVYHGTYENNYTYVEVYMPNASATVLNVSMTDSFGLSLVTPNTAGSIPSGYSNKEISFVAGKIVSNVKGSLDGNASSANQVNKKLSIQLNGGTAKTFNGSADLSLNITPSSIGAYTKGEIDAKLDGEKGLQEQINDLSAAQEALSNSFTTHTHKYAGSDSAGGAANSAKKWTTARTLSWTGDATGSMSVDGSGDKSAALTLANSGVTAGSYGQSAAATPGYGATFNVPYITVDAKGRVTAAKTVTVKIPASDNSDTKVTNTLGTTTKFYITGTNSDKTNTGTQYFDTGVYVSTTAGELVATKFTGALNGNANTASKVNNNLIIKLNGGSTEGTNLFTFNGSGAKTINITPSSIGAAASSHGTHVSYGGNGSATTVSRSDHYHISDSEVTTSLTNIFGASYIPAS